MLQVLVSVLVVPLNGVSCIACSETPKLFCFVEVALLLEALKVRTIVKAAKQLGMACRACKGKLPS